MQNRRKDLKHKFMQAKQKAEFILETKEKGSDKVPPNMKKK